MGDEGERRTESEQITRLLDSERIGSLSHALETLQRQNEDLRARLEKSEKDTHEFVAYFQREIEIKDEIIVALNGQLEKTRLSLELRLKETEEAHGRRVREMDAERTAAEASLQGRLRAAEDELGKLEVFREQRSRMDGTIHSLQDELKRKEEDHARDMITQERKFLADKAKTQREHAEVREEFARAARLEAQSGLDAETRRIATDNRRMAEELRFQQQITAELDMEKDAMVRDCRALRRDVSLLREAEKLSAHQGSSRSKELRRLHGEVEQLREENEKLRGEGHRAAELQRGKAARELEEHRLDAAALRKLLKLKNKELRHVRRLAQTILEQRTETEQFFLDAIDEVRRRRRAAQLDRTLAAKRQYQQAMRAAAADRGEFPPIRAAQDLQPQDAPPPPSALPPGASERVDFGALRWDDKERVLRLLFSKINAAEPTGVDAAPPEHPLASTDAPPRSR